MAKRRRCVRHKCFGAIYDQDTSTLFKICSGDELLRTNDGYLCSVSFFTWTAVSISVGSYSTLFQTGKGDNPRLEKELADRFSSKHACVSVLQWAPLSEPFSDDIMDVIPKCESNSLWAFQWIECLRLVVSVNLCSVNSVPKSRNENERGKPETKVKISFATGKIIFKHSWI